jgi:hypothetical protein
MKTIYRNLALGILLAVFAAFSVAPVSAQTAAQDEKTKLYNTYIENYDKSLDKQKIALAAAKQYVEKYGANAEDKEQVDYFKNAIPSLEEGINKVERETKDKAAAGALFENSTRRTKQKTSLKFLRAVKKFLLNNRISSTSISFWRAPDSTKQFWQRRLTPTTTTPSTTRERRFS